MAKNRTRIQYSSETYFNLLKETAKHRTGLERFIVLINLQLFWFSTEQQKTKGQELLKVFYLKVIQFQTNMPFRTRQDTENIQCLLIN